MILTSPASLLLKGVHVSATWGARCDTLVFLSDKSSSTSNSINSISNLTVLEVEGVGGREGLWSKVREGLVRVWKMGYEFDFLLKADDDTYIVMENLKALLREIGDGQKAVYTGLEKVDLLGVSTDLYGSVIYFRNFINHNIPSKILRRKLLFPD